eukprot:1184179-Prorocentrum_minimum.AAC.2
MASDDEHSETEMPSVDQPTSWQDFWDDATKRNNEAMLNAGKNPNDPCAGALNKHGQKIYKGLPAERQQVLCYGCAKPWYYFNLRERGYPLICCEYWLCKRIITIAFGSTCFQPMSSRVNQS